MTGLIYGERKSELFGFALLRKFSLEIQSIWSCLN